MSSPLKLDESAIRSVVEEVLSRLNASGAGLPAAGSANLSTKSGAEGNLGVFTSADDACTAAHEAFLKLKPLGVAGRAKIVAVVKKLCAEKAEEWGKLEFAETKIGRLEHKIDKLRAIPRIPGTEFLRAHGMSGDHGISMEEFTAFGVIGAITPVTHSIPTLSCNIVNMVSAGNTVVFNAHPNGAKCAAEAVRVYNKAFIEAVGIPNIVTIVEKPSLESFAAISKHDAVRILCVTGGPGVVNAAMKSGKRAICAGPGNPPVLVCESARLEKAARYIIDGGAYDNNLLCIGEKQVFVVEKVYNQFLDAFRKAGAIQLNNNQLEALTKLAFTYKPDGGGCSHPVLNRDLVGRDASYLAQLVGLNIPASTLMLFAETNADHAFVQEEQMMPMLPIVKVRDAAEGIALSKESEHGFKHSAMIFTRDIEEMTAMAREMDTTIFVKNGPCFAGLGMGGEGYASFSIATTTGEGISTPLTFTRIRRCVMVDQLRIW
ncbi:MAG: aldehyde dehydrogenase family protein [Verrucomicrobiota bacterium]|nr:aldehyde dehydrogenase family protein [Verrucomicrobiota bacterium]